MSGVALKEPYQQNEVSLKIFGFFIFNQVLYEEKENRTEQKEISRIKGKLNI